MTRKYVRTGQKEFSREEWLRMFKTVLAEFDIPITIRQLWYKMISHPYNFLLNNKAVYTGMDKWITIFRETGEIDWRKIVDRSRYEVSGYDIEDKPPDEYIKDQVNNLLTIGEHYRKELWKTQEYYIEVWIEKDTLTEIVSNIARQYRALTFPAGGQSSFTKVKEGALRIIAHPNEKKKILYLGDFDPHGHKIEERLKRDVNRYSESDVEIEWKPIGINLEQAKRLGLKPNLIEEKEEKDKSKIVKDWEAIHGEDKWEIDALPIPELEKLVEEEILKCITDTDTWNKKIEGQKNDRTYIKEKMGKLISQTDFK